MFDSKNVEYYDKTNCFKEMYFKNRKSNEHLSFAIYVGTL